MLANGLFDVFESDGVSDNGPSVSAEENWLDFGWSDSAVPGPCAEVEVDPIVLKVPAFGVGSLGKCPKRPRDESPGITDVSVDLFRFPNSPLELGVELEGG